MARITERSGNHICGIISCFYTGKEPRAVNEWVINQYEDQYKRGQEGFGIITIDDNKKVKVERACEPIKFLINLNQEQAQHIIVHHRMPTSSDNKIAQTHPIAVDNGSLKHKYLIVHNGIIRNEDELKAAHEALGFVYTTDDAAEFKFNDSESLAIELARYIENQTKEIDIQGSFAFVALQVDKKTDKAVKLFFGRDDINPLKIAKTRNQMMLSSEGPGEDVKEFTLYNCALEGKMELHKRKLKVKVKEVIIEPASAPIAGTKTYADYSSRTYFDRGHYHNWGKKSAEEKDPTEADTKIRTIDEFDDIPPYDDMDVWKECIYDAVDCYCESCADEDGVHFIEQLEKEIISACVEYKEQAEKLKAEKAEDKAYENISNQGRNTGLCGFAD